MPCRSGVLARALFYESVGGPEVSELVLSQSIYTGYPPVFPTLLSALSLPVCVDWLSHCQDIPPLQRGVAMNITLKKGKVCPKRDLSRIWALHFSRMFSEPVRLSFLGDLVIYIFILHASAIVTLKWAATREAVLQRCVSIALHAHIPQPNSIMFHPFFALFLAQARGQADLSVFVFLV